MSYGEATGGWIALAPGVRTPENSVRFAFSRSSGPGGQNVNKVNTRVQLWALISAIEGLNDAARERLNTLFPSRLTDSGEIYIEADTDRTQQGNRDEAMQRLCDMIRQAVAVPRKRRKTKPSRGSRERRLEGKRRRSQVKSGRQGRHSAD